MQHLRGAGTLLRRAEREPEAHAAASAAGDVKAAAAFDNFLLLAPLRADSRLDLARQRDMLAGINE